MTFDEDGSLPDPNVFAGKTIDTIIPADDGDPPQGWIITFTDGEQVRLTSHYDDSEVFWVKPR